MNTKALKGVLWLAAVGATIYVAGGAAMAQTLTVKNNCSYTVYPGLYPAVYNNGGWSMAPGSSVSFGVSSTFNGRIWGRQNCNGASPAQCGSGSCGGTGLQCAGTTGVIGTSLAEFNLNANGTDWYDVSYVDGMDTPLGIQISNGSCLSPNTCTSIVGNCPTTVQNGVDCLSPCTQTGNAQVCCAGSFNTPQTCIETQWPSNDQAFVTDIHNQCPNEYAWAYDDKVGLHTCQTGGGNNYTITFCPSGSGSTGGSTTGGGTISDGVHSLTPQCAPTTRLDDSNGGTTNGSRIQVWQAASTPDQQWNFANVGGGNYNIAVNLGPYCLDGNAGKPAGTPAQIWTCNGGSSEAWTPVAVSGGYQLKNVSSGLCLDDANFGTGNGNVVQSYTCGGNDTAQTWMLDFTPPTIANGVHTLTPQNATGSRLDDAGGGTTNGNKIQIWQAAGNVNQQWNFNNIGGTTYNIAVNLGPYCIDDNGGASGTATHIWSCQGIPNQKWTATYVQGGYQFQNAAGTCLDVANGNSTNGTVVQNYTCKSGDISQVWAVN